MTKNRWFSRKAILSGLATVAVSAMCLAQTPAVIYNNTSNYLGQPFFTANEYGDQVLFGTGTSDRTVTQIRIGYLLSDGASGNETAQLRLYRNEGPSGAPGPLVFDSGSFSISSGTAMIGVDVPNIGFQQGLTWSVLFGGIDGAETAGLLLYDPPTVGSSLNLFWENSGGVWGTRTIPGFVANFAAQVTAIPEPATVQLLLLGGLAGAGMLWRRRCSH
jgi:hypothetical protein